MRRVRPKDIIRQFRENGLKLLLHHSANVRDLVTLRDPGRAARMDFDRLTIVPTTFIAADYRHLASDVVVKVPYRTRLGGRQRTLTLYILIEHQSEPDLVMVLRVLEYVIQVYKAQVRVWDQHHSTRSEFRLQPVLPIVLYTGERTWDALTSFAELVEGGTEDFAEILPQLRPLFLNLSAIAPQELEASGGALGWVLELLRLRHGSLDEFQETTTRVVDHLEAMAETERERWALFLSYIEALIYHDRAEPEHDPLYELVRESVRSDPRRREIEAMWKSMADVMEERGRKKGRKEGREEGELHSRQQILERQLRQCFGRLPRSVVEIIHATTDIARLDAWLDAVVRAETLADVGITATPES